MNTGTNMSFIKNKLWVFLCLFPTLSYACTFSFIGSPFTVNYGDIVVQRDVAVGQAISNEIYGAMAHAFTCKTTGNEGSTAGMKSAVLTYAFTSSSGRRVYNTNLAGVGISFGYNENSMAGSSSFSGVSYMDGGNLLTFSWSSNPDDLDISNFQPVIQLWKTGNITSGSLTGQLASFIAYTEQYRGGELAGEIPINAGTGSVTQVACAVKTSNILFQMGDIAESAFGNNVGPATQVPQKTQSLILDCDAGANINLTLTGVQDPDVSDTSVLALTDRGSVGVASGLGVQLLYNNAPLSLNTNIVLKQSSGGVEMFPLTARYYQTNTSVSTGIANASATLNLTYQ